MKGLSLVLEKKNKKNKKGTGQESEQGWQDDEGQNALTDDEEAEEEEEDGNEGILYKNGYCLHAQYVNTKILFVHHLQQANCYNG
jgi:hypothetical protein